MCVLCVWRRKEKGRIHHLRAFLFLTSTPLPRSMTDSTKKVFLVGPGFIGGTLLVRLKQVRPDLELSALTRREDQAKELVELGIRPIKGSLDDAEIIKQHASEADIIFHTATADHAPSALAIVEGIKSRSNKSKKIIYIHTSGNDELVRSAKGMENASVEERVLSDLYETDKIDKRIQADAEHRQVDGPLRKVMMNAEQEKQHNASAIIMVPPLIYGVGSKPWQRISIQTPMIARAMMEKGIASLPENSPGCWNAISIDDLVEAYIVLLAELENHVPGIPQPAYYVFPAEPKPFLWRDHFKAVGSFLKKAGHPSAQKQVQELNRDSFYEFIGGKENPYAKCFVELVFGESNSYTHPE